MHAWVSIAFAAFRAAAGLIFRSFAMVSRRMARTSSRACHVRASCGRLSHAFRSAYADARAFVGIEDHQHPVLLPQRFHPTKKP